MMNLALFFAGVVVEIALNRACVACFVERRRNKPGTCIVQMRCRFQIMLTLLRWFQPTDFNELRDTERELTIGGISRNAIG